MTRRELIESAKVGSDPVYKRGQVFRGFYIVAEAHTMYYISKDGRWSYGCVAPDDGNWWATQQEAEEALAKFRKEECDESQEACCEVPNTERALGDP